MAQPLRFSENQLGLSQLINDEIVLMGGWRSGLSGTKGTRRLRYMLYDRSVIADGGSYEDAEAGEVEINLRDDNSIEGLVNIKLKTGKRRDGIGRKTVEALVASAPYGLNVYDIKKSALPFWRKFGIELRKRGSRTDGTIGGSQVTETHRWLESLSRHDRRFG